MSAKLENGKIVYLEIPAIDIVRSADFYTKVFGWKIKKRGDGSTAFDDPSGEVSGTWVVGRPETLEFIGKFRDPGGNVIGLYQEPGQ